MLFKVDTILSAFLYIVRLLINTAEKHEVKAADLQEAIDKASAAKKVVLTEAQRARAVADKITALLT